MASKLKLVTLVCELLNLGEEAKVENFVKRVTKTLKKENEKIDRNISTLERQMQDKLEDLADEKEDLEAELQNAYRAIHVDDLGSNKQNDQFMEKYLQNIRNVEKQLENLEKDIKSCKETFQGNIDGEKEEIALRNRRLAVLTKKA